MHAGFFVRSTFALMCAFAWHTAAAQTVMVTPLVTHTG